MNSRDLAGTPNDSMDSFWARLAVAPQAALLLDYDGTLAPFQADPAAARPYPGVVQALDGLMADGGTRVVIVTGRWARDLLPLLGLRRVPEIFGCHGREHRHPDGRETLLALPEEAVRALAEADGWCPALEALGGRCERKPASLALHWRGLAPARAAALRARLAEYHALLPQRTALAWHEFDGGVELRVPGRDKGDVVRELCAEMDPAAALAYLGDDGTDEDAFRAIRGRGLGVLVRARHRPTAAAAWLRPPLELLAFLARWREVRSDGH